MKKIKRTLLKIVGSLSLCFALIGIILPILPTTPFLLLSAYCYFNSSQKMYTWLLGHEVFGSYVRNYLEHKTIEKKHKRIVLVFLWASLTLSIYLSQSGHLQAFLCIVGIAVTTHVLLLGTPKQKEDYERT